MNTKLYKQVYTLAGELMDAANKGEDERFDSLYAQLKQLCEDNEGDEHKNHPVQWETLADFTQDSAEALTIYDKALRYAQTLDARDYMASICYAMALLFTEDKSLDQDGDKGLAAARRASEYSAAIEDAELQREISHLLATLQH